MTRQDQRASDGSQAIQAGGNVTVGMTGADVAQIIEALSRDARIGDGLAVAEAHRRIDELRLEMLSRFANAGAANKEAFADPDFQYAIRSAQIGFARSGEEDLKRTLIDMLALRSKANPRSRMALTLNRAIQAASEIPDEELSSLAALFIVTSVRINEELPLTELIADIEGLLEPFIYDVAISESSYFYLESVGCVTISSSGHHSLPDILEESYGNIFSDAIEIPDGRLSPKQIERNFIPLPGGREGLFRFRENSLSAFTARLKGSEFSSAQATFVRGLRASTRWNKDKIRSYVRSTSPVLSRMDDVMETTNAKSCVVTAVGQTVAHTVVANRCEGFDVPLETWIK